MAFNFERFTRVGGSFRAAVSIRKGGSFGLSQGALQRFSLTDGEWFIVLFYDKAARVIGMKPTRDGNEEGAVKLVRRDSNLPNGKKSVSASFSARSFLTYYDIPFNESKSFEARTDEESGMILVDLNVKEEPPEPT